MRRRGRWLPANGPMAAVVSGRAAAADDGGHDGDVPAGDRDHVGQAGARQRLVDPRIDAATHAEQDPGRRARPPAPARSGSGPRAASARATAGLGDGPELVADDADPAAAGDGGDRPGAPGRPGRRSPRSPPGSSSAEVTRTPVTGPHRPRCAAARAGRVRRGRWSLRRDRSPPPVDDDLLSLSARPWVVDDGAGELHAPPRPIRRDDATLAGWQRRRPPAPCAERRRSNNAIADQPPAAADRSRRPAAANANGRRSPQAADWPSPRSGIPRHDSRAPVRPARTAAAGRPRPAAIRSEG